MNHGIIIHGGAGALRTHENLASYREGLKNAVTMGFKTLDAGRSSTEAVTEAVYCMEESGAFNAGLGCCLTLDASAEVDAGIMDGVTMSVGAVAALRNVRHPILAARIVMEKTDHVLLVGEGATKILEALGISQDASLVTQQKLEKLAKLKKDWLGEQGNWMVRNRELVKSVSHRHGTVGAVAVDQRGNISAAASTGGYWLKLSGRVGDTPIPGAGFYASEAGGAVATGIGEYAIRTSLTKRVVDLMDAGKTAQEAVESSLSVITSRFGKNTMGLIALDSNGKYGYSYNTEGMGRAVMFSGWEQPLLGVFPDDM
jgi:beta-aspartyl-peptidase (threonine type)